MIGLEGHGREAIDSQNRYQRYGRLVHQLVPGVAERRNGCRAADQRSKGRLAHGYLIKGWDMGC